MPGVLGLLGASSAGTALTPALRVLTWPFLGLTILALGRGWYLEMRRHGPLSPWAARARLVLAGSTILSGLLWGLRFAGLLGARPW
ncbi:MAG: hypothetical protein HYU29_02745 [Chloroflexi bacterium]|nr:hypothetical protein [Chloroflexota bacterium]